ncbi:MAG: hypothetical protein GX918_10595 [Clostridiales bacterium]|nr:hypothetical protein [Clostridiales bacterium]
MKQEKDITLLFNFGEQGEFTSQKIFWDDGGCLVYLTGTYVRDGKTGDGELIVYLEESIHSPEEVMDLPWETYQLWWV